MKTRSLLLLALFPVGCSFFDKGLQPYYEEGGAPTISGIDVDSELGNIGGKRVTVKGSGFGTDANELVVIFGSANATILSVADGAIEVQTPQGPLGGGKVDVRVGTSKGYVVADDLYTYRHGPAYDDPVEAAEAEGLYDDEVGFIIALNYRRARYATEGQWVGTWGVDGTAEFLDFAYPRFHTASLGLGWFIPEVDDAPTDEWIVQTDWAPPDVSWVDDLHSATQNFSLVNPYNYGKTGCVNWKNFKSVSGCDAEGRLAEGGIEYGETMYYDLSHLHFCSPSSIDAFSTGQFKTEWVVDQDFFASQAGSVGYDVLLRAPDLGFNDVPIRVPEEMRPVALEGFSETDENWILGTIDSCFDDPDDDDENTTLSDRAMRFVWEPTKADLETDRSPTVKKVKTYVRFSYTTLGLSWMGLDNSRYVARSSITVPDVFNYDEETGLSSLEVPTSVLYQIPTNKFPSSNAYSDPTYPAFGYTFIVMERVTEYRLASDLKGDVVFAYVTGDFGIFSYDNPLDKGPCGNCIDDDGDGWVDREDPDCIEGNRSDGSTPTEDNLTFGLKTCNDGLDNDGDGLIDKDDTQCATGSGSETNCGDGLDNDYDGWIDSEDAECAAGLEELGVSFTSCDDVVDIDGDGLPDMALDSDGDTWANKDDPDCRLPSDEEQGFGTNECNDGIDNDGHGDIDAFDAGCANARGTAETTNMTNLCVDGLDNDGDGYIDANDPDCEAWSAAREREQYWTEDDGMRLIPGCYDGIDNDGDGLTDAADPSCWGADYLPDGFILDESLNDGCINGADDDGDGWVDFDDPECAPGVSNAETGFSGLGECSDGVDNDLDGDVDGDDAGCGSAWDPVEN